MTSTNITRDLAAQRSEALHLHTCSTVLDLRQADDPGRDTFGVRVRLELDSTVASTQLDFIGPRVDELVVNGEPRPVSFDGARLELPLAVGRNVVEVSAHGQYSRSGQGLHRFVDPADGNTYLYTQFEPADARRVFPCFEQPDLKARHQMTVLAPGRWVVRANQHELSCADLPDGGVEHRFAATEPLSSYLVAITAGPWHQVSGHWSSGDGLEVELGLFCRQALVPWLDHEALLQVTRQGLDFFHREFGHPYPWGKYDQVFVPEYNLGAMENPGLVTFTEAYLPRSAATRNQYQGRANTILHEMAHMWFGDLVTPAWWDDLWLKESFAEFMGSHASTVATEFTDAWVAFAGRRKAWAYAQDQLPTTHPIVADIPDVEAAKQNFDGITYAKGAAVLKQLVAYVGIDAFFAGSREYFRSHAFSSARLADLLQALERSSGRDLAAWSAAWLQTAGPDVLAPVVEAADGQLVRLGVRQDSRDARDGSVVGRPHTLRVGLYSRQGDELVRTHQLPVELDGREVTWLDGAHGLPAPDLVLVNDEDLTYAKVALDDASLATVLADLSRLADPLARALCWAALWNMVRDAELDAADFVAAVAEHAPAEDDVATLTEMLERAATAIDTFLPEAAAHQAAGRQGEVLWQGLQRAGAGSDEQLVWARALARVAARAPQQAERLAQLLAGELVVGGLELGPELRWRCARALAAQQLWQEPELDAELARDPGKDGVTGRLLALAARPDAAVKAAVWQQLHPADGRDELSNDHVDALCAGFMQPGQEQLVAGFAPDYFAGLEQVWRTHSIEIAERLVENLFPHSDDAAPRADEWLQAHPQAPGALRRLVLEGADNARRAARARQRNS